MGNSLKKDYIVTFLTEFTVLASGIIIYRLAASFLGKIGFSEYLLCKRTIAFFQPVSLLGLSVGIPRYIAYKKLNSDCAESYHYFISGAVVLIFFNSFVFVFLNLLKRNLSFLIFNDTNYNFLILPISLMILALVLHQICYSYYRGNLLMFKANLLQIINLGLLPVLSFMIFKSVFKIILINSLMVILVSLIFFLFIIKEIKFKNLKYKKLFSSGKELILYGVQRVPGDFGISALLSLPTFFTSHIAGIKEAGYVSFGISILSMTGALFAPLGLILLPKASQIIAEKKIIILKSYVKKIFNILIFITLSGIIIFLLFGDKIISIYLGKGFSDIVKVTKIITLAIAGYAIYVSMRSIIDAYYVKAVNTINILIALSFFLIYGVITKLLKLNYIILVLGFIMAIYILCSLTLIEIKKILR